MHDSIEIFYLTGRIGDSNLIQTKERIVHFMETQMRDQGYVPVLDILEQFTLNYLPEEEQYEFELSVYGIKMEDSWGIAGVMGGKTIPSSLKNKSVKS